MSTLADNMSSVPVNLDASSVARVLEIVSTEKRSSLGILSLLNCMVCVSHLMKGIGD